MKTFDPLTWTSNRGVGDGEGEGADAITAAQIIAGPFTSGCSRTSSRHRLRVCAVFVLRSVRLWFSLAVAVIASAIADPLLEAASNAGIFGNAHYTDHSNLDVLPALAVGLVAVAIHVGLRI